jgi:hypothetical protein
MEEISMEVDNARIPSASEGPKISSSANPGKRMKPYLVGTEVSAVVFLDLEVDGHLTCGILVLQYYCG